MACTGILLGLFLLAHLAGNATAFWGRDAYNTYAGRLHGMGILLSVAEALLALVFLVHAAVGTLLFFENRQAGPGGYAVAPNRGRHLGASTMPYTGLIIFVFVLVHLANFHFTPRTTTSADLVREVLSVPGYAAFYLFGLAALALHISHGFWSMLQSLGISHPRYDRTLQRGGLIAALLIGAIFMLMPILAVLSRTFLR